MSMSAPTLLDEAPEREEPSVGLLVMGDPMPWPRAGAKIMPRKGGRPIPDYVYKPWIKFHTPHEARERAELIAITWRSSGQPFFAKPALLVLRCEFIFARPKSHYGTGRNANIVKPQYASARPGGPGGRGEHRSGGDIDNLTKLVLDGLNEVAFDDDAQVVRIEAEKAYTDQAGVVTPRTIFDLLPVSGDNSAFGDAT